MRYGGKLTSSLGVISVVATALIWAPPAAADSGQLDIYDAHALIQQVSPDIANETAHSTESALEPVQSESARPELVIDPQRTEPASEEDATDTLSRGVEDDAPAMTPSPELTITPTYVTEKIDDSNGIGVWRTDSDQVAAYVQPIGSGVRVLTAVSSSDAPRSYSYDLDVPVGTSLRNNALGFLLIDPNGSALGQLLAPWAKDANGADVPTSYSFSGNTLTQEVELDDPGIAYPVLVDPAWTYVHTRDIGNKTPSQVRSKLLNCFNCYFPVEGAPRNFPSPDQSLPLIVRPFVGSPVWWNFHCYFGYSYFDVDGNKSWFGYDFRAAADHVDGEGSTISFDFNPRWSTNYPSYIFTQLVVSGYIMNDDPVGVGQPAYLLAATTTWNQFAYNLSQA